MTDLSIWNELQHYGIFEMVRAYY